MKKSPVILSVGVFILIILGISLSFIRFARAGNLITKLTTSPVESFWMRNYTKEGWNNLVYDAQATIDGGAILSIVNFPNGSDNPDVVILKVDSDGQITWQKAFDGSDEDYSSAILQTSDSSFIAVITTVSFSDSIWLIKLDADGNMIWQKTYNGGVMNAIKETSDGGYVLAGASYNTISLQDAWVMKLSSDGNIIWQRFYGGSQSDSSRDIHELDAGEFIVTGTTRSFGSGATDVWVLKLNADGSPAWQKTFGGSGDERAWASELTLDGGLIFAGETDSFGAGMMDAWVVKLDSSGNILWQKTFGLSHNDRAWGIIQTQDGAYVLAGTYSIFDNITLQTDGWIWKLNSDGSRVWERGYGGEENDELRVLSKTTNGNILAGGFTNHSNLSDALVIKVNSISGDIQDCTWIKSVNSLTTNSTAITQDSSVAPQNSTSTKTDISILPITSSISTTVVCIPPPFIPTDFIYLPLITKP